VKSNEIFIKNLYEKTYFGEKSSLIFILWKFYQKYVLVMTNKVSKMYKDYIHVFISYSFAIFESLIFLYL